MEDFDKAFEAAPSAEEFDKLFDEDQQQTAEQLTKQQATPAISKPKLSEKIIESAISGVEKTGELAQAAAPSALDFALGASQGATLGFADEISAGINQLLDPLISKISGEEKLNEQLRSQGFEVEQPETTYEQELERTRGMFKKAEEESPWLYGAGYLGGSLPAGQAIGGGLNLATKGTKLAQLAEASRTGRVLKNVAEGALGLGIESIGESEGSAFGTPEQKQQLIEDIKSGGELGAIAGAATGTIGEAVSPVAKKVLSPISKKIEEFVESRPFLRQLGLSKEYGEKGINPVAESQILETGLGKTSLATVDTERAQSLMNEILEADKKLGRSVEESLVNANKQGIKIEAEPIIKKAKDSLNFAQQTLDEMGENSKGRYVLNKIQSSGKLDSLNPVEAKDLLDDVDAYISKFGRITPGTETSIESKILRNLKTFRNELSNELKDKIGDYRIATQRFKEFRRFVPETIMAGSTPSDVADIYMGDLREPQKQLLKNLKKIIQGSTQSGSSSAPIKEAYVNTIRGLKKFEQQEARRGAEPLLRSADEYAKEIRNFADDAAVRRQMANVEEMASVQKNIPSLLMDTGSTVRSGFLTGANIYGQAKKSISNKLFNAPREQLSTLADRLSAVPGLNMLGDALKQGVETNDSFKKNAALYSILQNPNAKLLIDSFVDTEDERE